MIMKEIEKMDKIKEIITHHENATYMAIIS
jgi:hypothetical protein